jgi:hypothetical protein
VFVLVILCFLIEEEERKLHTERNEKDEGGTEREKAHTTRRFGQ